MADAAFVLATAIAEGVRDVNPSPVNYVYPSLLLVTMVSSQLTGHNNKLHSGGEMRVYFTVPSTREDHIGRSVFILANLRTCWYSRVLLVDSTRHKSSGILHNNCGNNISQHFFVDGGCHRLAEICGFSRLVSARLAGSSALLFCRQT